MAFALAHAQAHSLRRVIVVIPFLSIIEQNATVYREVLGDDVILEHHSAAPEPGDIDEEEKAALETATENWDAPIVVTTSVQFLESLFADKPAKCRKLHRIAKSVVIFDEVQTLPTHLLAPVLSVFRELQRNYGVSFVFSSATQPAFRKTAQLPDGFTQEEMREIAPEPPKLFQALRRVDYHFPKAEQTSDWPELAQHLASERQALCVVNLRHHAAMLWEQVREVESSARSAMSIVKLLEESQAPSGAACVTQTSASGSSRGRCGRVAPTGRGRRAQASRGFRPGYQERTAAAGLNQIKIIYEENH
jgi:CRISPR-associated endonuclease/helicase Cas3